MDDMDNMVQIKTTIKINIMTRNRLSLLKKSNKKTYDAFINELCDVYEMYME